MDQLPVSNSTSSVVVVKTFQHFGSGDSGLEVQGYFQLHSEIKIILGCRRPCQK